MFSIGDKVCLTIDRNIIGVVTQVVTSHGAPSQYKVFHDASNISTYFENQLQPITDTELSTETALSKFCGLYAARKMSINSPSTIFALNEGKIKFIPFQFRPLAKILKAERPRLLIADEVGVGKTIETGIILKEFERRNSAKSIIIICPKDLTSKWRLEMKSKFDEAFEVLSSDRLNYCLNELEMEGVWPYECRKCIIGLELLRRDENISRLKAIEDFASFDMLIVDEAHHVINQNSNSYQIAEYFCESCDIAVFLSATPLQLGSEDLFSLLALLLPDEFMDYSVFTEMAEPNKYINAAIRSVRNISVSDWREQAVENLNKVCVNNWATKTFSKNKLLFYWLSKLADKKASITDIERIDCLRDLESLHTFSHVINRTKRKDIGNFTIREPITVSNKYNNEEQNFYTKAKEFKEEVLKSQHSEKTVKLVMSTIERQITSSLPAFVELIDSFISRGLLSISEFSDDFDCEFDEYNIKLNFKDFEKLAFELKELSEKLPEKDSKAQKLLSIIDESVHKTDAGKLLVFSFFKNTLRYLYNIISEYGARVEIITGDTSSEERNILRRRFRLPKEDPNAIDVLLCSEVGCEGLDYEFCSRMVNYDIPWNPMKIEQRIGRIDRFGQKSPKVQIYNFITEGTIEEKIFYRCYERLGIFNSTIGDLEGVLGEIATELSLTAFDVNLSEEQKILQTQQLIDNAIRLAEEQKHFEEVSRDLFLMDIESSEKTIINERSTQIQWQKHILRTYLDDVFPDIKYSDVSVSQIKLNVYKPEKQKLLKKLVLMKRSKEIDKNNNQVIALENFLNSDYKSITISFDSSITDTEDKSLFVSATHPLMLMAVKEYHAMETPFFTSCTTKKNDIIGKGKYLFACYEWKECGYRESNDLKVFLFDAETKKPIKISLTDFEQLILSAEDSLMTEEPDMSLINSHIYAFQKEAKEKLLQINKDIIARKLSTLNNFYSKQIEMLKYKFENAQEPKIRKMYQSKIQKTEFIWKDKQDELNNKLNADILVNMFASGSIEVE